MNLYDKTIKPLAEEYERCKNNQIRDAYIASAFIFGLGLGATLMYYVMCWARLIS